MPGSETAGAAGALAGSWQRVIAGLSAAISAHADGMTAAAQSTGAADTRSGQSFGPAG